MSDIIVNLTQPDEVNLTLTDEGDILVNLTQPDDIGITLSQAQGEHGIGIAPGGTVGQVLAKKTVDDYDTEWISGGGGAVDSVNTKTGIVVIDPDDLDDTLTTNKFMTAIEKSKLSDIPAVNDRDILFNDLGDVGASSEFRYDKTAKAVIIGDASILPDSRLSIKSNIDSYAQVTFQNINNGPDASTDWVATADNGDDTNYYIDMGINSSTYNSLLYSCFGPNDGYLYVAGGNLVLNTDKDRIDFVVGGTLSTDKIGEINTSGMKLETGMDYFIDSLSITDEIDRVDLSNIECGGTGLVHGGLLTQTGVNEYSLAAGNGYIAVSETERRRITWSTMTGLVPIGDGANYIRINASGNLDVTLDGTYDVLQYIEVGYVFTGGGNAYIIEIVQTPAYVSDFPTNVNVFSRGCLRALVSEGLGISEQANPNELYLTGAEGVYFAVNKPYALGSNSAFTRMFNSSDFGWVPFTNPPLNKLVPGIYNVTTNPAASALVPLTDTYWKTDIVFRVPSGNIYVVCGQAEYATEQLAKDAPLATLPGALTNVAILLAKITMQKEDTSIANRITDIRPYLPRVFGFGSASAGAVQSHSSLTGLGADDHTQYFNETRGDLRYAPIAKGITNGDTHDHVGGDGAQISYTGLSNIPLSFAPASHGNEAHSLTFIDGTDSRLTDSRNPLSHGDSAHSETYVKTADARLSDARTPTAHKASHVTGGTDIIADAVPAGNSGLMTGADKTKLNSIATGAEVNVNADWNSGSGDSQIMNKPSTFTPASHAANHVTGGSDVIANAVAGGNAGLMTGADKTKLNALTILYGTGAPPSASGLPDGALFIQYTP